MARIEQAILGRELVSVPRIVRRVVVDEVRLAIQNQVAPTTKHLAKTAHEVSQHDRSQTRSRNVWSRPCLSRVDDVSISFLSKQHRQQF